MPGEYTVTTGILLFAIAMLLETNRFPAVRVAFTEGPELWPRMVLGLMAALTLLLYVDTFRRRRRSPTATAQTSADEDPGPKVVHPANMWYTIGLTTVYVYLLPLLGFLTSTALFLFTYMWSVGLRRSRVVLPVVIISCVVLGYLFTHVLKVPLPRGIGAFRRISLLFY